MRMMNLSCFIFLFFHQYLLCSAAATVCPSPVVDDIGISYHTKERFDRIRKDKNTLSTTYVHHRNNKEEKYKYIINFCGPDGSVAVEQRDTDGKSTTIAKISGASVLIGAEDWLLLQYFDGKPYNQKHCGGQKRQAWVSIRCEDRGEKPMLRVIEEARYNTGNEYNQDLICYYLFEYNHPAACSVKKKKPMNGFLVFLIILLVLFCAYFIFGFLYLRFVGGKKGHDQIPHHKFWQRFGNLMADGCSFVCRTEEASNTYKGMADALDIDSDDDNDDLLRP